MEYYLNQLINGICQGAIYALIAIGYAVVVGAVGMVSFAHGSVIMIGAFAAYYTFGLIGNNIIVGILASFSASFLLGIFIYKVCYERFFNASRMISLLCTIGVSMLLKNLGQIVFGYARKPMLNVIEIRSYTWGGLRISSLQIIVILVVIIVSLMIWFLFNKTKWGISMRAVSQDKTAAYMVGINVRRTTLLGTCIGCSLGGVAGMLYSIYYQYLEATMGGSLGMKAFSATVLGGLTDVRLSSIGGLILGIIENLGISVTSASYRDIFAFILLIIILVFRPKGLAAKKGEKF